MASIKQKNVFEMTSKQKPIKKFLINTSKDMDDY